MQKTRGKMPKSLIERFMSKVAVQRNGCWLWTAAKKETGYGAFGCDDGRTRRAHRVSYELHVGPIPVGKSVLHSCDNRACVNPDHLWLGTQGDNMNDMNAKGRGVVPRPKPGERNPQAKLTAKDVLAIRAVRGVSQRALARRFKVDRRQIGRVLTRQSWQHI